MNTYRNIYRFIQTRFNIHIYFLICQLRGSRYNNTSVATCTTSTQIIFLISFSNKLNQDSLNKWLILVLEQVIYKMSLEDYVVSESKNVLRKLPWQGYVKGTQKPTEKAPFGQKRNNSSNKI